MVAVQKGSPVYPINHLFSTEELNFLKTFVQIMRRSISFRNILMLQQSTPNTANQHFVKKKRCTKFCKFRLDESCYGFDFKRCGTVCRLYFCCRSLITYQLLLQVMIFVLIFDTPIISQSFSFSKLVCILEEDFQCHCKTLCFYYFLQ